MAPTLHNDWLLVFVGVVLWWVSCVVVLVFPGLLRGSSSEDPPPRSWIEVTGCNTKSLSQNSMAPNPTSHQNFGWLISSLVAWGLG